MLRQVIAKAGGARVDQQGSGERNPYNTGELRVVWKGVVIVSELLTREGAYQLTYY